MSLVTRISINYRGRVQGVGFRWNVKQIVDNFPCSGYVKNLKDGSVDVLLEGKRSDLNNCISLIEQRMSGKWVTKTEDERPGKPLFEEFFILY